MKEPVDVDGLGALLECGRRLQELDPERFQKLLTLARTYVAIYERADESEAVFLSRIAQAHGAKAQA